jgi:hypothetical protein
VGEAEEENKNFPLHLILFGLLLSRFTFAGKRSIFCTKIYRLKTTTWTTRKLTFFQFWIIASLPFDFIPTRKFAK